MGFTNAANRAGVNVGFTCVVCVHTDSGDENNGLGRIQLFTTSPRMDLRNHPGAGYRRRHSRHRRRRIVREGECGERGVNIRNPRSNSPTLIRRPFYNRHGEGLVGNIEVRYLQGRATDLVRLGEAVVPAALPFYTRISVIKGMIRTCADIQAPALLWALESAEPWDNEPWYKRSYNFTL